MTHAIAPALVLFTLLAAGCTADDDGAYPRLLPLDQVTAAPAVPAHAADAAADPQSVAAELRARAAAARSNATAAQTGPLAGADNLRGRADDLRRRADALRAADPAAPDCAPGSTDPDCPQP